MGGKKNVIPSLQDVLRDVSERLFANHSLSALYINCSAIGKIEGICGKKIYTDVVEKIHEVMVKMKGKEIRNDDILASSGTGSEEFLVFLAGKRDKTDFFPSDLESLCTRVADFLNISIHPVTFPYLRGGPKISVGYAITIHNPLKRDERLINRLIEDARLMSNYHEFKRLMRYKEKLQELILKESVKTIFQPIVDFRHHKIIGYEALTRGPEGTEFENPYTLFDAAAETDLLFELDRLCRKKSLLNAKGLGAGLRLFMNCLPSAVLDPSFKDTSLESLLKKAGIPAAGIVFEFTEREAIDNYALFNDAVRQFTNLGFAIAVDDAGSGFSSLETIVELCPHFLKLDISLIRGIEKNFLKQELIKAIRTLSEQMGSTVIAEGIETGQELLTLRRLGITIGQGFLFARPGPAFPAPQYSEEKPVGSPASSDGLPEHL